MSFLSPLLDFLYPKSHRVIELENISVGKLLSLLPPAEDTAERGTIALFDYKHPLVKEVVWQVKYSGNRALAQKLGTILYDAVWQTLEEENAFEKFSSIILM